MNVELNIDADLCVGYGECVAAEPTLVAMDDRGCAHPLVALVDRDSGERICRACPVGAISLRSAAEAA